MSRSPAVQHKSIQCINGHEIQLRVVAGTEEKVRHVRCPGCGRLTEVSSGELVHTDLTDEEM
jgi:hypothetical protein